ncbi:MULTISPECIES: hypothetical protein [Burkholderia]|nr:MULTISPECIES: hypothetical protein [Burkholderia]
MFEQQPANARLQSSRNNAASSGDADAATAEVQPARRAASVIGR